MKEPQEAVMVATNKEPAKKLDAITHKIASHDQAVAGLVGAIRQLTAPGQTKRRPIGIVTPKEK
jgi:hypothetical protein